MNVRARAGAKPVAAVALLAASLLAFGCGVGERHDVLVLVNEQSPISVAIGDYYRARRELCESCVLPLSIELADPSLADPADEEISRSDFDAKIREPVEKYLEEKGWRDRIRIIVTTKGIPLRIAGNVAPAATWLRDHERVAVDAELSLLFSPLMGRPGVVDAANPYFDSEQSFDEFRSHHPDAPLRYMVARLTGYQTGIEPESKLPSDIRELIDAAQFVEERLAEQPPRPMRWLIDEDPSLPAGTAEGNRILLAPAAAELTSAGFDVVSETSEVFASDVESLIGYASWGSNATGDPGPPVYGDLEEALYPGEFLPRAVALDLVSTNARTFTAPPEYGQSLIADLIHLGVSGAAGHVDEPTLPGVARPAIFLRRYAEGLPAIEAYYRSLPFLGWVNVYIGDPLMRIPDSESVGEAASVENSDRDLDGIEDGEDNCTRLANPLQRDTDGDGFGNWCDADIDNDGIVTTTWGVVHPRSSSGDLEAIALAAKDGSYRPELDLDGDGLVDERDISIANMALFRAPGPSARD